MYKSNRIRMSKIEKYYLSLKTNVEAILSKWGEKSAFGLPILWPAYKPNYKNNGKKLSNIYLDLYESIYGTFLTF